LIIEAFRDPSVLERYSRGTLFRQLEQSIARVFRKSLSNLIPRIERLLDGEVRFDGLLGLVKRETESTRRTTRPPAAARPRVDALGSTEEVGRNPNDRHLDSNRRPSVADSAALHATFLRHQAAHGKTEIGVAEPAATAPNFQTEGNEIEAQTVR